MKNTDKVCETINASQIKEGKFSELMPLVWILFTIHALDIFMATFMQFVSPNDTIAGFIRKLAEKCGCSKGDDNLSESDNHRKS